MTPLTKPQPGSPSVRPDQLTIPTSARSRSSNTGPPESPLQTPRPAVSPSLLGSIRLSCCELGRSVATSVTARSLPAVLRSPCTPTPKPATMNRSPTKGGARRPLKGAGARFGAGGASLTRARSGASARGENCGWGATLATSFTTGRRPSNASSRYLPLLRTQCAAVSTRSGAIATPVHRLCPPTISTTCRAIARSAKGAPPTIAAAGTAGNTRQARAPSANHDPRVPGAERAIGADPRRAAFPVDRSQSRACRARVRRDRGMVGTSLPRHAVRVTLFLWKEHLLDFVVDAHEPCLGAGRAVAKVCGLGLGFPQSLFGCSKLKRELMSQVHGALAVFVRHVRGLLQHGHNRAPGVIGDDTGIVLPFRRRRKRDNGTCFVGNIRTHRTHSAHG